MFQCMSRKWLTLDQTLVHLVPISLERKGMQLVNKCVTLLLFPFWKP